MASVGVSPRGGTAAGVVSAAVVILWFALIVRLADTAPEQNIGNGWILMTGTGLVACGSLVVAVLRQPAMGREAGRALLVRSARVMLAVLGIAAIAHLAPAFVDLATDETALVPGPAWVEVMVRAAFLAVLLGSVGSMTAGLVLVAYAVANEVRRRRRELPAPPDASSGAPSTQHR